MRKTMGGVADRGTMGEQRNVVQEFYERFGDGDLDAAAAVFAAGVRISDPGLGVVEGLEALRNYLEGQTLLVHAWRKFPFLDPDLPADLLPPGWPRDRAQKLFVNRHERWGARAIDYFQQLEAERMAQVPTAA